MKDWRPKLVEELPLAVVDYLHRVFFETRIKLFIGTMPAESFESSEFGLVQVNYCWQFSHLDFDNMCRTFAEEVGHDLLFYEKSKITKYGLFIYTVTGNKIRYAKVIHA